MSELVQFSFFDLNVSYVFGTHVDCGGHAIQNQSEVQIFKPLPGKSWSAAAFSDVNSASCRSLIHDAFSWNLYSVTNQPLFSRDGENPVRGGTLNHQKTPKIVEQLVSLTAKGTTECAVDRHSVSREKS